MKNVLLKTHRSSVTLDTEKKYFEMVLKHDTHEVELFKQETTEFLKLLETHRVEKILWLFNDFKLVFVPELQTWIDENINQKEVKLGVKREAFVFSDDIFMRISVEQTMDEGHGQQIESNYFTNKNMALDWLLEI